MSNLQKQDGDNVGGFNQLQIVELDNCSNIPDAVNNVISSNIELLSDWIDVKFTIRTLRFSPGEDDTDKGNLFKPTITFFHAKDNDESLTWLENYNQKNIIAKLKDNNGNTIIVGSIKCPLRLKYQTAKNNSNSSRPGYNVTIYGLNNQPAFYFTGNTLINSGSGSGS